MNNFHLDDLTMDKVRLHLAQKGPRAASAMRAMDDYEKAKKAEPWHVAIGKDLNAGLGVLLLSGISFVADGVIAHSMGHGFSQRRQTRRYAMEAVARSHNQSVRLRAHRLWLRSLYL